MSKALTDVGIRNLRPGAERREIADGGARGLYLVVQPSGVKGFALRYRLNGKPQKLTLGRWQSPPEGQKDAADPKVGDPLSLASARKLAGDAMLKVGRGDDPADERRARIEGLTVAGMLDDFISKYAHKKLRSADQYASTFDRLVKPVIGNIGIYDLRRSHVTSMLHAIAGKKGEVAADRALAYFRRACNWQAIEDENFNSPIVKGMREKSSLDRQRVLDDQELRDLWAGLDEVRSLPDCYPRFIKMLLLNMNRRNEAADMASAEVEGDLWIIPGKRYKRLPKHKGLDHVIPLSRTALDLIGGKPSGCKANSWFIFSTTSGAKPFSGFSKAKRELDKAINAVRERDGRPPIPEWRLHDLRRTGRTLMSRAGVNADHAERCLGHIIGGVRGTYDRYEYLTEKRAGFEALARQIDLIVNERSANVVQLRGQQSA